MNGLAFVFFGLLEWVENVTWFLVFSYLIRMLEGKKKKLRGSTN